MDGGRDGGMDGWRDDNVWVAYMCVNTHAYYLCATGSPVFLKTAPDHKLPSLNSPSP